MFEVTFLQRKNIQDTLKKNFCDFFLVHFEDLKWRKIFSLKTLFFLKIKINKFKPEKKATREEFSNKKIWKIFYLQKKFWARNLLSKNFPTPKKCFSLKKLFFFLLALKSSTWKKISLRFEKIYIVFFNFDFLWFFFWSFSLEDLKFNSQLFSFPLFWFIQQQKKLK